MTSELALAATVDSTDHTRGGGGPQLVVYGDFECPYTAAATHGPIEVAAMADTAFTTWSSKRLFGLNPNEVTWRIKFARDDEFLSDVILRGFIYCAY